MLTLISTDWDRRGMMGGKDGQRHDFGTDLLDTPNAPIRRMQAGWLIFMDCAAFDCCSNMAGWIMAAVDCAKVVSLRLMAGLVASCLLTIGAHGLTIDLKYDYDSNGFFDDQTVEGAKARKALEFAVRAFEPFTDSLLAIEPQWWTASFTAPGTGVLVQVDNLRVNANTLVVYVGGRDLEGNQVGAGGPGGWHALPDYSEIVRARGQRVTLGTSAVDYGPWGGALAFDTTYDGAPRNWHLDVDIEPSLGQVDFLSVAVHELAHLLGFGIADSYDNLIEDGPGLDDSYFTGQAVQDLNGGQVAVEEVYYNNTVFHSHWARGTRSPPYENAPRAAMGAALILGSRVAFSPLDYAGLADTGWEVPPALLGLPGDVDGDLDVDGRDFIGWQHSFGLSSGAALDSGDTDGDGDVDLYDGWVVRRNLGARARANAQTVLVQVPEPTALNLLLSLVTVHAFLRLFKPKSGQTLLCG